MSSGPQPAAHPGRVAAQSRGPSPRQLGLWAIGLFALVVIPLSALFDSSTRPAPTSAPVSTALQHFKIGPGPALATVHHGALTLTLSVKPNRPRAHNLVSVKLTHAGQPVAGAHVNVSYGMPAMAMGNGLSNALPPTTSGLYSLREPILGMAGLWTMHFTVHTPKNGSFSVTADDMLR